MQFRHQILSSTVNPTLSPDEAGRLVATVRRGLVMHVTRVEESLAHGRRLTLAPLNQTWDLASGEIVVLAIGMFEGAQLGKRFRLAPLGEE